MPRAKGTRFDPGMEATLLMCQPGVLEAGRVVDDLETAETSTSAVDTAPIPGLPPSCTERPTRTSRVSAFSRE